MILECRISELKIKAISERERSRHLHPQCDTRNRAVLTCKLFTFVGVNRTCGSFLSPEARQRTVLRENSNNQRLSLHTPCRAGTLRKRKSAEIPGGREAVNTSQLIIEINHSGAGQTRKKGRRTTIIQYVGDVFYSPAGLFVKIDRSLCRYVCTYATGQAG